MANRAVKQPNGLYARFSDIVDDFTHMNYSREELITEYINEYDCGRKTAEQKLINADAQPHRFEEEIECIKEVHGKRTADRRRKICSKKA